MGNTASASGMLKEAKVTRRTFVKLAAVTGAALAMGGKLKTASLPTVGIVEAAPAETLVPTCCNICGGQTGVIAKVADGRVVKIEPNPENPSGVANTSDDFEKQKKIGAAMCPKGNAAMMTLYDPDRVKKPLMRTNPNKGKDEDPKWKEISYDEALTTIAGKLKALQDANEMHKLLWISEDHSFTHIQQDFVKLFGTPNYNNHSNLCDTTRKAIFKAVMGHDRPLADFAHSKYALIFGWNFLSATKWALLPGIWARGKDNGMKMVYVSPVFDDTAARADEWVSIIPGTDAAMALAIGNVIVSEGLYDKDFVANWTYGFEDYKKYVADKTPEWAEKITSVPADTTRRIARDLAKTKPALVDVWSGPGQHSNAFGGRAIAALNALIGSYDAEGGMVIPDKRGNSHQSVSADAKASETLKNVRLGQKDKDGKDLYPYFHGSGCYTEIMKGMAEETLPYMPKVGIVVFQNLVMSIPGTQTVIDALKKLEFLVVVDTHISETALLADIVIPGTTYLERYDWNSNWVTWSALGLRQPAVNPIFGQLKEVEFVAALGRKLGIKDKDGKEFFSIGAMSGQKVEDLNKWYEEFLSKEVKNGTPKMTLEEIKALPGAVWIDKAAPTKYKKYVKEVAMPEGGKVDADGLVKDKDGKVVGVKVADKIYAGFATATKKAQFKTKELEAGKKDRNGVTLDPLPAYTPRDWQPESGELYLINWKEISHTHTRTFNNVWLMELKGYNPLYINTKTAASLGIKTGDKVNIENKYGKVQGIAWVTEGVHPQVVGQQHGFGHWALGSVAKGKGHHDAWLRPTKSDPVAGQALHKECCVKVTKA